MTWPTLTLRDVLQARHRIAPHLQPTPVLEPAALGRILGCDVALKCEHMNPTGAFKVRGGVNLVSSLEPHQRRRGVLAVSTGNHAQSVAFAARLFGVAATIYMPERANPVKVAATRALGAEVVLTGRDFDEARLEAERQAAHGERRYIHSANEPLLIAGVGTWALELFEAVPDLDLLFVPVGAGSGAIGASIVARAVHPQTRVIGVQAEGAAAVYQSWKTGRRVVLDRIATFAEGLATREPFDLPMALLPGLIGEIMTVSDAEIRAAMRLLLETTRQITEGAGAAALAAAWQRRADLQGRRVGLVLSGGNLPTADLKHLLEEPNPWADRLELRVEA